MKYKQFAMKRTKIWLFFLIFSISSGAFAQDADQKISELINTENWFTLEEEFPKLKDSLHTDLLKLIGEAMIGWKFNQYGHAISSIETLLANNQKEIGSQAALNFSLIRLRMMGEQGRYAEAADGAGKILNQLKANNMRNIGMLETMYTQYNTIRECPAISISRPQEDVTIPFALKEFKPIRREPWMKSGKKNSKDFLMTIPVVVHGKKQPFIFDTGASRTFIQEQTAKELNLKIFPDTIMLNGDKKGKLAYIDSLQVGNIICRNIIAYVGLPNAMDSLIMGYEAILGIDFINAIGETQIQFDKKQIVFPHQFTSLPETDRNLCLEGVPLMKASKGGKTLMFNLDTGCTTAYLHTSYYQSFKSEVDAIAEPDTIAIGSYDNIATDEVLLLPEFSFEIGSTPVTLDGIYILSNASDRLNQYDGRMGMDLIGRFRKTTINLREMFVKLE